ncbi:MULTISPECIES: PKD domain-containing protein [Chitinophagaceae]
MKNHLCFIALFGLLSFCSKLNAQTFTITVSGKEVTSVCTGIAPSFTCTSGGTDISWDFGNGQTSSGTSVPFQYTNPGTYTITMTDNANGLSTKKQLTVRAIPNASYSVSSTTACTGSSIIFTSTSSSASPITLYKWDFGDGSGGNQTNPSIQHSFNLSGSYTPTLIVQDQNGCTGTSTNNKSITIGGSDVQVSFQANGTQFYSCDNTISFVNNSNENGKSGIDYIWDFGDGSKSNQKNPDLHTYRQTGAYTVSLKASYGGNTGCSPGFTKTVYIGKPQITINAPSAICALVTFDLKANIAPLEFANSPSDLSWQIDNGSTSNGGTSAYFNNVPGDKQVRVSNINGCPNTVSTNIMVKGAPQISLTKIPTSGICVETTVSVNALPADNTPINTIQSYKWDLGDGSAPITNVSDHINHIYSIAGSYTLNLTATNTAGCASLIQLPISVKEDCTDNGYGSAYNPVFSFESASCDNKYTITLQNKIPTKRVKEWIIDGTSYPATNEKATAILTPPAYDPSSVKKYDVQTVYQDGTSTDKRQITIIDEHANFAVINTQNKSRLCANNVFSFNTDTSLHAENISSFIWTINSADGQVTATLKGNNPTFTFPKPGDYNITLAITDIRTVPCTSQMTKTVHINGMSLDLNADSISFCYSNPTLKLHTTIATSDANVQYIKWDLGDGTKINTNTSTTDTTISHQYNYTGGSNYAGYTLNIEVGDISGCIVRLTKNNFTNIYRPKASFNTADTLLCSTDKIIIQNTSNAPSGTYLWRVGSFEKTYSNRSNFNNTFKAISNPSTMDVFLKVTDGGCSDSILVKDYIRFAKPKAILDIVNKDILQECPPYTLIFKNQSQNTQTTTWNIITNYSNSTYPQPDSIYFTVRHPGPVQATLIATLDGCSDTTSEHFVVKGPIATLQILDTLGCTPFNSRMKVTHNDDVNGYQWVFGDSSTIVSANADSITHTYKTAGTFFPKVSVSGIEGCTDSLDIPAAIVASRLSPSFSAFNITDKCSTDTPRFLNTTPSVTMPITKFIWNWGNRQETVATKDTVSHFFNDTAMYIPVSLTAVTDYCSATSDTVIVSPHFANNISIIGDSMFCNNTSLHLTGIATKTPDHNNRYSWYNQNDSLLYSGSDSILILPVSSVLGNQIKLRLTNTFGCTNDVVKNIQMRPSPIINLQDSIVLCQRDSLLVQANAIGTFSWTSAEGLVNANTSSPTIFPNNSTYYYATVTNSDNCISKDSIWVQVDSRIGTTFQDSYKSCLSDTVPIAIHVNTEHPSIFTWRSLPTDNSITNTVDSIIHVNPRHNTTYHFIAHSRNVCPDETGDILLQYTPAPIINFANKVVIQPAGTIFNLNPDIQNLTPRTKFTWYPDIRMDNRYLQNPSIVADKDITYTLNLLDQYGCTTTDSVSIKVLCNSSKILMANAFTPNGDGKNDRFCVTGYGIKNVIRFTIIDRWGKKVFERNNSNANDINQGWDGTTNGKAAQTGTYLYTAEVECTEGNRIPIQGSVVLIR